ncbi:MULTISPECIES: ABC transporter ATP-binding protein [Methylobacterium]|jgi:peptide/nickel transport system ATP-binding protein|uniref:nickel ABC transporter ATP-binding protein NikE n=2 Tax=Methylobacteriaceae TaxID=119045 RepID=UPI0008DED1B8|nr:MULTISPECIES: ABC transporter ATP-binding protein [Methylobacterium]MBZ6415100.1 ABC transporter ATP-binding protein [Methylobacterium sp.]MBK3401107.1 ABC transporter ATP-binding protein [Methylobacterium ajmalii]MBK3412358.1 ABC transporter ATP-binding protein [Methylobacterium ajmalii]MBK3421669.1 ABC transporter ATP-binding protein [Methylobacterium ajmalii]SFF66699.1 peptide/nickel transport system ATP-binding protein [Methylobacterium sp. yr596]
MQPPLLSIEDLRVTFATRRGPVEALRGVSLSVAPGESLGLVGESGSGKSVTAFAAARLLDRAGRITGGSVRFRGQDVTRLAAADLRAAHGQAIGMIFQNPRAALNPIRPIGRQLADVLMAGGLSKVQAKERALESLEAVRIRDAARRLDAYPHELSGGMCQRVMIALALACRPALLIADEPTTGLDVTTQKTVMDLVARLTAERGMAMILITHDLGLAAQYCGRIAVMEQGRLVEEGEPGALFAKPRHPYTKRLVAASPTPTSTLSDLVPESPRSPARPRPAPAPGTPPLLAVEGLGKMFGGAMAVEDVSFSLREGESLGLVGESGSGKSTTSRMICRLLDASAGKILFDGESIGTIPARDFHRSPHRRAIQIVFQDPTDSLNPRFSAFDCIAHPLKRLTPLRGEPLRLRVIESAERAGLPSALLDRFPHQLSGGQKARIGIARAIAVKPRLLVLDEPTAALDVSVQAGVLRLLDDLRREDGLAVLFVSHDLNVVRMMCERTLVLQGGRVVEEGVSRDLFRTPRTAYTRELLAAIPHFRPGQPRGLAAEPAA